MPIPLQKVTAALQEIAPLHLAEEWDNVGLLVEPSKPKPIQHILLTIDLTDAVLDEAIRKKSQMVVAYHPPIFDPIKRLSGDSKITRLIEHNIAVYSPHTALDSAEGGVNDRLADAFGTEHDRLPIKPAYDAFVEPAPYIKAVVFVPVAAADRLRKALGDAGIGWICNYSHCSFSAEGTGTFLGREGTNPRVGRRGQLEHVHEARLEMITDASKAALVERVIRKHHPYEVPAFEFYPLVQPAAEARRKTGQGRTVVLRRGLKIGQVVSAVKKHLKLSKLQTAIAPFHREGLDVVSIAVCAGAGGSVVKESHASVWLTGEMRHHDVLAANARGISVILAGHTNTERPYLPTLKKKMHEKIGRGVTIEISKVDRDPLRIV